MTKKSKIYLVIIAGSLLFTAGSLVWQKKQAASLPPAYEQQEEIFEQEEFLPPADLPRGWVKPQMAERPPAAAGGFSEEKIAAYLSHPVMKAFNDEIIAAVGDVTPEDFTTGAAHEKYFNNPQIQKILLKYSKDPAFLELMRQMMSDETLSKQREVK